MWVFRPNNFTITRYFLLIFWAFVEYYRLNKGFSANIEESFPELISFDLMTIVFSMPPQFLLLVGNQTMPIDKSVFIVYICFAICELILSLVVMIRIVKRKAAVFLLHNSSTESNIIHSTRVKSSKEIIAECENLKSD